MYTILVVLKIDLVGLLGYVYVLCTQGFSLPYYNNYIIIRRIWLLDRGSMTTVCIFYIFYANILNIERKSCRGDVKDKITNTDETKYISEYQQQNHEPLSNIQYWHIGVLLLACFRYQAVQYWLNTIGEIKLVADVQKYSEKTKILTITLRLKMQVARFRFFRT